MNRCTNFVVSLIVLSFVTSGLVWAKPTSKTQAEKAVKGWLKTDSKPLNASMGSEIVLTEVFNGDDGKPAYYIIYLNPSGFVIVSADDLIEPVVGFVAGDALYDPSPESCFGALVSRDLPGRIYIAKKVQEKLDASIQKKDLTDEEAALRDDGIKAKGKWKNLQDYADSLPPPTGLPSVSDVRVAPLTQSLWSQSNACSDYCYNYYTPSHYVCGCLATAMAQFMRYWSYPTAGIGVHNYTIYVNGGAITASTRGGDGSGGPYVWSQMVLAPANNCPLTDIQRQAIGALCYDAGVAVHMQYSANGSGAIMYDAQYALKNTFTYSNVINGGVNLLSDLYDMMNPNLDAGMPVLLGVYKINGLGHAIVSDGYGYNSGTIYHHLNMGWAGLDNAWYNLPNIDASHYSLNAIDSCIYNVYESGSGEIISGRVTYSSGAPYAGATVTATGTGGPYTATTNINGTYGIVKVRSNTTYTVSVSSSGCTFTPVSKTVTTGTSVDRQYTSGNKRDNDFTTSCTPPPPPPAPAAISYPTSSSTGIYTVTWSSSSGATLYEMDRSIDNGSTWSQVYLGAGTSYSENAGSSGNYRYRVKAINAGGSSSWTTGTWDCVVTISPPPPPAPPASITYPSNSTGHHTVSWAASSGATSYQLERTGDAGSTWSQVYSGANNSYQEDVDSGTYRYRVKATNSAGSSDWATGATDCVVFVPPPVTVEFSTGTTTGWDFHTLAGDIARNNVVDLNDLNVIAQHWLDSTCSAVNNWCNGADIDGSNCVDLVDYSMLAKDWSKQAGENILLQTIYGTAQDSTGNITANSYRALSKDKGMAMVFKVLQDMVIDKGIFKWRGVRASNNIRVRLYNVTGKGYLNYNHTMTKADPGSGGLALVDSTIATAATVPSHSEGTIAITDMVINFGPLSVTAGEYLIVFDASGPENTWGSLIRGTNTEAAGMGKYPDGTALPKCATVTTTATVGNTYYYELGTTSDTSYTPKSYLFAFQITIPTINQAPQVVAGPAQTITEPNSTVTLDGTVLDDGLPNPPGHVTTLWTKQSGPGAVTFGDANSVDTTATFSATGTYVLRLTANDGALTGYDETIITYQPAPNQAPVVDAGIDQTITIPNSAVLDGTVTDDGLPEPPGAVTSNWTMQSGPGLVTFTDANSIDTNATFSIPGEYVLRLSATDGLLSSYDEVTITVE